MIAQRMALLAAADHIDRNPDRFFFYENLIPEHLDDVGCALGWVGYFAGAKAEPLYGHNSIAVCEISGRTRSVAQWLGFDHDDEFYQMMDSQISPNWADQHRACARGLRKIADCRFPDQASIMGRIRAWFNPELLRAAA